MTSNIKYCLAVCSMKRLHRIMIECGEDSEESEQFRDDLDLHTKDFTEIERNNLAEWSEHLYKSQEEFDALMEIARQNFLKLPTTSWD